MKHLISTTACLLCPCLLFAATITNYAPSTDGNWSNPANWIGGIAPANGDTVVLDIQPNVVSPTNVDIAGLTLNTLAFSNVIVSAGVAAGTRIVGNPLSLNNIVGLKNSAPVITNTIAQNVTFLGSASWAINVNDMLIFEGVLTATNPNFRVTGSTGTDVRNSRVILLNTNNFARGYGANSLGIEFYHPRAVTTQVPAQPTNAFFAINYGGLMFNTPPDRYYKYVINANCGFFTGNGVGLRPMGSSKVIFSGIISDSGNNGVTRAGNGYMMVLAPSNAFTGNFSSSPAIGNNGGITRAMGDYSFGLPLAARFVRVGDGNSYDLNGYGSTKDFQHYDGGYSIRNYNLANVSTCSVSALLNFGGTLRTLFAGPGDIVWAGNIITGSTSLSRGTLMKGGCGTLTFQGESHFTNWVAVRGGTLVLDYRFNNNSKLARLFNMTNALAVRGAVEFIGNNDADTVEYVTDIDTTENSVPNNSRSSLGPGSIKITTGTGRNFTLAATRITRQSGFDGCVPVDVSFAETGGGAAAVTVSAMADGPLGGKFTVNQNTFATISGGAVAGLPNGAYSTAFPGSNAGTNVNVDVTADTAITSNAWARTLRFAQNGATEVTISDATLNLPQANDQYGGILITPAAGQVDIVGNGLINLGDNTTLALHHYGNDILLIGARLGNNSANQSLCKVGLGELILTNDLNQLYNLQVFGGVVTVPALRNRTLAQPSGQNAIILGDGTLRYVGAGDTCDRAIGLRGNAVIDASGSGPLELAAFGGANRIYQVDADDGDDMPLTLTGTGVGLLDGVMQMAWGCLHKRGSGTWYIGGILSNLESFVHEGTLVVTGRMVSDVYVKPGATLAGNGTVARELAVFGTVAPGLSIGALDAGCLSLNPGCVYQWEVDANNTTADVIRVGSVLELPDLAPNSVTVKVVQVGAGGIVNLPAFTFEWLAGDTNALVVDTSGTGFLQPSVVFSDSAITITMVPEPAALLAVLGMFCALMRTMRQRA